MATSLFFMPTTDQKSGEIRTTEPAPVQKSNRGRKPGGSRTGQQNQKKQKLRGMGVAQLEQHIRAEEEKKMSVAAPPLNPNDPVVVLQGFPSYAGLGHGGGSSGQHQIMIDPVWSFVAETSASTTTTHELSSIPNHPLPQISINCCDTCCFKKKRLDGEQNAVRSNGGGGFTKQTMINGYDQRSHGFFYDHHRLARSITYPYFNEVVTNHTGSMEGFGSGKPRNGGLGGGVKEYYEFFPEKYDDFPEKTGSSVTATSLGPYASSSTIDLSLKL